MKRPAGLVFAAVLLILISAKQLAIAALVAFAGAVAPHQATTTATPVPPHWLPAFMFAIAGFCILLAAWGIATAVGVLRARPWACYSILVVGGCLAFFGLTSAVGSAVFFMLPLPLPASTDPAQVHAIQSFLRIFLSIMVAYDLTLGAIGVWWLAYFNRPRMRELFAHGVPRRESNQRPLLISIFAVLNAVGGVTCLVYAFLPLPAIAFGFAFHGWSKALIYLVFAVAMLAVGWGLWMRQEWGRRLALGLLAFGMLNTLASILRPPAMTQYTVEVNRQLGIQTTTLPPGYLTTMFFVCFAFGIVFAAGIAYVLIRYRAAFVHSDSSAA